MDIMCARKRKEIMRFCYCINVYVHVCNKELRSLLDRSLFTKIWYIAFSENYNRSHAKPQNH